MAVVATAVVLTSDDDDVGTRPYKLVAPATIAGFSFDPAANALDPPSELSEDYRVRLKAALGGTPSDRMSVVYTEAASGLKLSIDGMTGTGFIPRKHMSGKKRLDREANNPLELQSVEPGPNGGSAECSNLGAVGVGCSWLTSTTFVVVQFSPRTGANKVGLDRAVELLHAVRSAVEKPA